MCITDRHDMTLAVKVALNPNKPTKHYREQMVLMAQWPISAMSPNLTNKASNKILLSQWLWY